MIHSKVPQGIVEDFRALEAIASRRISSERDLEANLRQIYDAVLTVDFDRYDVRAVHSVAPSLMQAVFELRIQLRNQIAGWHAQGYMSPPVQKALRDVFRVSRYAVDVLGEIGMNFDRSKRHRRAFTGGSRKTSVNPAFYDGNDIQYRAGDVILVRGTAHNSAAIARIGDVDSQFSHVGIVHVDDDGKPWVVEALIETGSIVETLEHFLDSGIGRAVLYRHRDPELAARAAKAIHERVKKTEGRWHRPILYDFSFELGNYKQLFCSKLIRQAFDLGSGGKLQLPTFMTRLDAKNRDFYDRVGATAKETFAPGDLDLEPHFDLVAEWQDFRQTSRLRLQDLMMDKVFQWMERDGWVFQETAVIRVVSWLGKAASYLSNDAKTLLKDVFPRVPVNMTRRTVAVIAMLHKTGEELMIGLKALEEDSIHMRGRPAHPKEIFAHLETVRSQSGGQVGYLVAPKGTGRLVYASIN